MYTFVWDLLQIAYQAVKNRNKRLKLRNNRMQVKYNNENSLL